MPIISVTPGQVGLVGVLPSIAYINTSDTLATVTTTGYLNKEVANGLQFSLPCLAAVSTQSSPTAAPVVSWFQVAHVAPNWSLVAPSSDSLLLPSGDIFVGNSLGIAAAVAMSGDATISNTGALTIAAGAITNAKVSASAAIAFSKLATLASGNILVGNVSGVATSVAMSGAATISNAGVVALAANSVDYTNLATDVAQVSVTTLTSAQLNALYTTSQLLVAPAGAATLLVFDKMVIDYHWATADTAAGGAIAAQYGSAANGAGILTSVTIAGATLNALGAASILTAGSAAIAAVDTSLYNTGIYLGCQSGVFTGGGGGATVYCYYKVLTPA